MSKKSILPDQLFSSLKKKPLLDKKTVREASQCNNVEQELQEGYKTPENVAAGIDPGSNEAWQRGAESKAGAFEVAQPIGCRDGKSAKR